MPFFLKNEQRENLALLRERPSEDVIELCKCAFDYLQHGPNLQRYESLAKKYCSTDVQTVQNAIEALISLLIDATKANAGEQEMQVLQRDFSEEIVSILAQFVCNKRNFVEGSIKSANIRAYRLVNLEWRLEVRVATRSLLQQDNICVAMKLFLHTEPKNENRDLLAEHGGGEAIHDDERRNRKDLLVQTDLSTLVHMIQTLEDALAESRSRRIRNIVDAIH